MTALPPPPVPQQQIGSALFVQVCVEDDPCWNWKTMGNHCRGLNKRQLLCYDPLTRRFWRQARKVVRA